MFGRVIGRGAQGCVRLAMCKATKKRYVVKQLNINHRSLGNGKHGASSGVNDDELERVGGARASHCLLVVHRYTTAAAAAAARLVAAVRARHRPLPSSPAG